MVFNRTITKVIKLFDVLKLRKTQTNGSMYHAHGLEELTSSKWPYYPKQFIDSMQSLPEYP